MTLPIHTPAPPLEAPVESITALTQSLVRAPSIAGVHDYVPVVDVLARWMSGQLSEDIPVRIVHAKGTGPVGVAIDIGGSRPGPRYLLNACLDTAGIGDLGAWSLDPFSGAVINGWLYGRGSADSKAAVSIFSHLAAELARRPDFAGTLSVLFDLDEHTGGFAGIRRYLEQTPDVAGVMIGYPGTDRVVTGGRGFYRARITVHGEAAHTGATRHCGVNAITRAARLVTLLDDLRLPVDLTFPHPPKSTVTAFRGGEPGTYSVVPDRVDLEVDIRLTPAFTETEARALLVQACARLDDGQEYDDVIGIHRIGESWPAFQLPADHPLPVALLAGARQVGLNPTPGPAGPSNIGCLLASRGIPATAGFGVAYRSLHGTDEAIDLSTIPQVYAAYRAAVLRLLT